MQSRALIVVFALASWSASARADEAPATPPTSPASEDAGATEAATTQAATTEATPAAAAPPPRPPRVRTLALGMGYHATLFRTQTSDRYAMHGPAIVFDYFIGRKWGFALHAESYFPLWGRMNGPSGDWRGSLRTDYTDDHYGFDFTFMAAYRHVIRPELVMVYAGGLHVQTLRARGPEVSPIELITGGFGGVGRLEWLPHRSLYLAAQLMLALDPLDFIDHANRAVLTTPLSGSITLGFRR